MTHIDISRVVDDLLRTCHERSRQTSIEARLRAECDRLRRALVAERVRSEELADRVWDLDHRNT